MQKCSPTWPPISKAAWIAAQEQSADADACHRNVSQALASVAARLVDTVCGPVRGDVRDLTPYLARLWACIDGHWQRLTMNGPIRFGTLIERLEMGNLGYARTQENVLRDVVLSQALELQESQAAAMFEEQYMPIITAIARRTGGERSVDDVDNFAATLILPRGDRPCRIAQYQGRTTLAHWLRAVVANECISHSRSQHTHNVENLPEKEISEDVSSAVDESPCESLLRPLMVEATVGLSSEDRLLIKMLVLDNVPQKALAKSLGINSGNVTRRRQKITAAIWQRVQSIASQAGQRQRSDECLELVLAGPNPELRRRLGQVLAGALALDSPNAIEDSEQPT